MQLSERSLKMISKTLKVFAITLIFDRENHIFMPKMVFFLLLCAFEQKQRMYDTLCSAD